MDDYNNNNNDNDKNDKQLKRDEDDNEEKLKDSKSSTGSLLPDLDQIGNSPKDDTAVFRSVATTSMPTLDNINLSTGATAASQFARAGGGAYLAAPDVMMRPPANLYMSDPIPPKPAPGPLPDPDPDPDPVPVPEPKQPSKWHGLNDIEIVPSYYPLEQSSKTFQINHNTITIDSITNGITKSLKIMSIQPKYVKGEASVALLTPDNVEMYLCLWRTRDQQSVVVEVQRRRGCSIAFHKYCRNILDAAEGKFDGNEFENDSKDVDFCTLRKAEKILFPELNKGNNVGDGAVSALKIAHGFIQSVDRLDEQLLGVESLVVLTNPRKTSVATAIVASRAALLGVGPKDNDVDDETKKMCSEIRDFLLTIILNRNLGDTGVVARAAKMNLPGYDSDDEDYFNDDTDIEIDGFPATMRDAMGVMLNLALTIMANSLEVLMNGEVMDVEPETTSKPDESPAVIAMKFISEANDIAAAKGFKRTDMLKTLMVELGRAKTKTHNACLAAKSLRHLCKASEEIYREVRSATGSEQIVHAAFAIGKDEHARLEREIQFFYQDHPAPTI